MKLPRLLLGAAAAATVLAAAGAAVLQVNTQNPSGGGRPAAGPAGAAAPALLAARDGGLGSPARGKAFRDDAGGGASAGASAALEDQQKIARVTARLLAQSHYARLPLNDAVASTLLDRYLDALDPQRVFFLQSDVAEFAPLRTTLDDLVARGDVAPAREIFTRFLERVDAQVATVKDLLKNETFTFNADDVFITDRKNLPRPADLAEAKRLWRDRLRYEYLQEKLNKQSHAEIVKTVDRRYGRMARALHEYDRDDVFELFLSTLARVYDPHTEYFGKASSENFGIRMRLSLYGIGAQLQSEDGYVKIMGLTPGGPAIKSKKLKPGDRVVAVAQGESGGETVDVVDMKLDRVVEMIRGPKGTTVRLTILPADAADTSTRRVVTLVRDEIRLEEQAAKAQLIDLPGGGAAAAGGQRQRLGVIDLPLFYQDPEKGKSATTDVARLLAKLKKENVAGVILDLRRNGGGSLPEAISLTGLFIRRGPVVQVRGSNGVAQVERDNDASVAYDGPLVVLISRFSASASEIVAGALQDYGRAVIVGDASSFGKGTVQAVVELAPVLERQRLRTASDPGSLHLTVQKFYRPGGASTQLKGVVPDIVLPSQSSVLDIGERSLEGPLPWDTIPATAFEKLNRVQPYLPTLKKRNAARVATDKDFAYLRQQIARYEKTRARNGVSLNEAQRKKERDEAQARAEARKKELASRPPSGERVYALTLKDVDAPGLPPPVSTAKAPTAMGAAGAGGGATAAAPADDADSGGGGADEEGQSDRDITLDEARRILGDLVALQRTRPR